LANYTSDAIQLSNPSWEEEGSPVETWNTNGLNVQVTLRSNWADASIVLADILDNVRGYPNLFGTAGKTLSWAATGTITPTGKQTRIDPGKQGASYEQALIQIGYQPSESNDAGGGNSNIFSETLQPNAEFLTVDPKNFTWGSGTGTALNKQEAPGKIIQGFDYVQTRFRLAAIPPVVLTLTDTVNNANVTASLLGLTFAPETLMFNAPTLSRQLNSKGEGLWTMATRYSFRKTGWNKFWRKSTKAYEEIYEKDGAVYKNFPLADFSGIIV